MGIWAVGKLMSDFLPPYFARKHPVLMGLPGLNLQRVFLPPQMQELCNHLQLSYFTLLIFSWPKVE